MILEIGSKCKKKLLIWVDVGLKFSAHRNILRKNDGKDLVVTQMFFPVVTEIDQLV